MTRMDHVPALHAYLRYQDAPAGLRWLEAVGFDVVARQEDGDGRVTHAEVRLGEAVLMIASADDDYDVPALKGHTTGTGLYVWLAGSEDVDRWFAAAVAGGASPVFVPEFTEWHARRARVLDPEGHEWSIGTYRPGQSW
jgi:uncharacterized glyoxalase superfamily protein PhnB